MSEQTYPPQDFALPYPNETAWLSAMLFRAREDVDMLTDIVESRTGRPSEAQRRLVAEIDAYRARRGWSPHGFGGEQ